MEVYTLDSLLRREEVVDRFISIIWTERFAAFGDFEIHITSNRETRRQFKEGRRLSISRSNRVMVVETVEDLENAGEDGRDILKVKGRSIEALLLDRVAKNSFADLTASPTWTLTGTPGNIARQMFDDICRNGLLSPYDIIPFLVPGTMYNPGTLGEPTTVITHEQKPATLYKAVKDLCDLNDLGFRMYQHEGQPNLYFDIYSGNDRTTVQQTFEAVVFAPGLHNLQNVTKFASIADAKNVAYVFSEFGSLMVYGDIVDPDVDGFERRVLLVDAGSDIKEGTPEEIQAQLLKKGKEELLKQRAFMAFDGEIDNRTAYVYGRDYELGDLVEMRTTDGVTNQMRVTEQIFVCDIEGMRSYPTLSINTFIYPGSWEDWMYRQYWIDFGATEYWADQP